MNKKKNNFLIYSLIFISLLVALVIFNNPLLLKNTLADQNDTNNNNNKSNEKYISIIQNIRNLLEQLSSPNCGGPFSVSQSLPVTGSKSIPKLFLIP